VRRRRSRRPALGLTVGLSLGLATCAHPALARDPDQAAALFREGREAAGAGDYELACRRFAESESLDPRVGTLINLALCDEGRRKLAAAYRYWQQATDFARATSDERAGYCAEQLARIDLRVPRLTIRLEGDAPPDTTVTRDGVDFGASSLGVPLPVELGAHTVAARAPHRATREVPVDVPEGGNLEIAVGPGPQVSDPAAPPPAAAVGPEVRATPGSTSALRTVAYLATGAGAVALAVGAVFGARAINAGNDASSHCEGDACDAAGAAARRNERSAGGLSTAALVTGGALITAGAAAFVLAPPPGPAQATHARRNLAYVLGGAGLVAGGVGAFFGVRAIDAKNASSRDCTGDVCGHVGAAERRDEIAAANVSTIALVTGGLLLGGGVVLWATAPEEASLAVTPAASATGAAMRLEGTW
jgi:hypothetical protein